MKKVFIYFFLFLLIFFLLPALLTKKDSEVSAKVPEKDINEIENQEINQEHNYKNYGVIKLLHKKTGEIEEVPLDMYLCNVVSSEMPVDFELEALKAQAVVARTYTIYKIQNKKHENSDICDDSSCCQAWISKEERLAKWDENER